MKQSQNGKLGLFLLILPLAVTWLCYKYLLSLGYSDYKDLLATLLNISAVVFAIIGAWIAVIYPEIMGRSFTKSERITEVDNTRGDINHLSKLVEVVLYSSIVLMAVLSLQFLFPILKSMSYLGVPVSYVKVFTFYVIFSLTILQLSAIFKVVLMNYYFLRRLRAKNNRDYVEKKIQKRSP